MTVPSASKDIKYKKIYERKYGNNRIVYLIETDQNGLKEQSEDESFRLRL